MNELLFSVASKVRDSLRPHLDQMLRTAVHDNIGDPHFTIDDIAERALDAALRDWPLRLAYFSEDRGLVKLSNDPDYILIVDPIDGTRSAMSGFESCCFSAAVAPFSESPTYADISHAIIMELQSGDSYYAARDIPGIMTPARRPVKLGSTQDIETMFWSLELTAHPVNVLMSAYGHMVDASVRRGAVFVFTSSSFSLTRIITGQLDAHIDIGHRLLNDDPSLLPQFEKVGGGCPTCLFPYDIAAAAFIAEKAGAVITDAYGKTLQALPLLTDKSMGGQLSLVAAANKNLHQNILKNIYFHSDKKGVLCAH